jgi:hypothetical protein
MISLLCGLCGILYTLCFTSAEFIAIPKLEDGEPIDWKKVDSSISCHSPSSTVLHQDKWYKIQYDLRFENGTTIYPFTIPLPMITAPGIYQNQISYSSSKSRPIRQDEFHTLCIYPYPNPIRHLLQVEDDDEDENNHKPSIHIHKPKTKKELPFAPRYPSKTWMFNTR